MKTTAESYPAVIPETGFERELLRRVILQAGAEVEGRRLMDTDHTLTLRVTQEWTENGRLRGWLQIFPPAAEEFDPAAILDFEQFPILFHVTELTGRRHDSDTVEVGWEMPGNPWSLNRKQSNVLPHLPVLGKPAS